MAAEEVRDNYPPCHSLGSTASVITANTDISARWRQPAENVGHTASQTDDSSELPVQELGSDLPERVVRAVSSSSALAVPPASRAPSAFTSFSNYSPCSPRQSGAHPLEHRRALLSCVKLLDAKRFSSLPQPLPRAQDLPAEYFALPRAGDIVMSVSHAWRNQAHPDPTGQKSRLLSQIFSEVCPDFHGMDARESSSVLVFLDFISIPQRPFRSSQEPRTAEEAEQFQSALELLHEAYFFADRIIQLPWEDCKVPEEGRERHVLPADMQGATFAQIGDCVQVASCRQTPTNSWHLPSRGQHGLRLFDQVVSVDGQPVTAVEQLEALLAADVKSIKVRQYPFGLVNNISADERGWVFLERFITMIKCAMVDRETAKEVVITPSERIFNQIMDGADRMRNASLRDRKRRRRSISVSAMSDGSARTPRESARTPREASELKKVLDGFLEELMEKHFSPASSDKREMDLQAGPAGLVEAEDLHIVSGMMRKFVENLSEHWEQEAALQRSIARRVAAAALATEKLVAATKRRCCLEWDSALSEGYMSRLESSSSAEPWPAVLLLMLPPAVCLAFLLLPYASPEDDWTAQLMYWCLGLPLASALCGLLIPASLSALAGAPTGHAALLACLALALASAALAVALCVGVAALWGVFPVPMAPFVVLAMGWIFVPGFYFWYSTRRAPQGRPEAAAPPGAFATATTPSAASTPAAAAAGPRPSPALRLHAVLALGAAMLLFGLGLPLLTAVLAEEEGEGYQALLVPSYLASKLAIEVLGAWLSQHLGADAVPHFVFLTTMCYEVNMSFALAKVRSWLIAVLLISLNAVQTVYHFRIMRPCQPRVHRGRGVAATIHPRGVVASVVLRQFVEAMVPVQFLVMYILLKEVRPGSTDLLCNADRKALQQAQLLLFLDFAVSILVTCLTHWRLTRQGLAPFSMLGGLIRMTWASSLALTVAVLAFYMSMHHSHWGMDYRFELLWVVRDDARWLCGSTWSAAP